MSQGETGSLFYVLSSSRTVTASSCHDSLTGPVHLNIICPEKKNSLLSEHSKLFHAELHVTDCF